MDPTNPNLYGRQYNFPANSTNTGASPQNLLSNPAVQGALVAGGAALIGSLMNRPQNQPTASVPGAQNVASNSQSGNQYGSLGNELLGAVEGLMGNRFDGQAPNSYQYPGQAVVTSYQGGVGYQQPGQATVTSYQGDMGYQQPGQAFVTSYGYGPTRAGIGYQAPQSRRAVVTSYGAGQPGIGYQAPQTSYGSSQAGMGYQASYNGTMSPKKKTCGCGH